MALKIYISYSNSSHTSIFTHYTTIISSNEPVLLVLLHQRSAMGPEQDKQVGLKNSSPKYVFIFISFLLMGYLGYSQTTIWSEDFNSYSDGTENGSATGPSATDWTTDRPGRLNVQSGRLRGQNLDAESTWATGTINIYGYTSVSFSLDVDTQTDTSQFEQGTDYFIGEYRIGGSGAWTEFENASGDSSPSDPLNSSYSVNLPTSGSILEIRVRMYNTANNEQYYIDNVLVEGTLPFCLGEVDFEFYDSVPSGNSVDNIPTSGALGTGVFTSFDVDALQNQEDPGDTNTFSIRYTGYIQIDTEGSYTFYTSSDDGSKLFLDGVEIVDNDGLHGNQERSGTTSLTTGLHDITVLFFENGGSENLTVQYEGPSISKQNVPFGILYSNCSVPPTPNDPPSITATGNQSFCPGSTIAIVETVSITDPDDTDLDAVYIQITDNYDDTGDLLSLTGTHPNITATWSSSEGRLLLDGPATLAEFESAVLAVEFQTTATINSGDTRTFSIVLNEANYLASTGHYYEYVPNLGITWTSARDAAALRTFYGLQGYLATISSQDESDLLGSQASGAGWIGASDETVEGDWYWVTGPEAGTLFWRGTAGGTAFGFEFWNTGEPNQSGNEDYAHITAPGVGPDGSWNDLSNTGASSGAYQPQGYLVEYGGMPGDPAYPNLAATTTITVDAVAPTASTPAPITVYCAADIPSPDVNIISDEADNCDPNPSVTFLSDVSDGGSNPEIITRTYRITDAYGNVLDVQQSITVSSFSITAHPVNQSVLVGNNAIFSVTAIGVDTYQWEVSTDGGINFVAISDGTDYSGTQTASLTVINPDIDKNNYQYRVAISNSGTSCSGLLSNPATLSIATSKVITNRRITFRVNRD